MIDWVDLPDRDLLQIWVWIWCGWLVASFGVDFEAIWRNDHYFQFPRFWLDFHHFICSSSLFPCSHSDNALSNAAEWALRWMGSGCCGCVWHKEESRASIAVLDDLQEPRCLFVREGWREYFLWLWRHPCSGMHMEDTHRWDWACLNVIHSGWESLSRVMWWGYLNVELRSELLSLVLSVVSLGKSSQSIHIHEITSHYQCAWSIILFEPEWIITHLNGSQFRQVC